MCVSLWSSLFLHPHQQWSPCAYLPPVGRISLVLFQGSRPVLKFCQFYALLCCDTRYIAALIWWMFEHLRHFANHIKRGKVA